MMKRFLACLLVVAGFPLPFFGVEKGTVLDEPGRKMRTGDMIRITLILPDRTLGSLEAVTPQGEVATPEGSFLKAGGISLETFTSNLMVHYSKIRGYEDAKVKVLISSSPYKVVRQIMPTTPPRKSKGDPDEKVAPASPPKTDRPPMVLPRVFKQPLTLWGAIQEEGGIPPRVDASKIKLLKQDLTRKTFDCSGKDGAPDGKTLVESGDYIFLVPEDVPVSKIFE